MAIVKQQSDIKNARDQLFLDTADGVRLNIVSSNLGMDRPLSGMADDEWRAAVKAVALQPKLIKNIFHRVLEICVGPQKTRKANLALDSLAGAKIVEMEDSSNILQLGTLIFSPGQANEETIEFCFRDLVTQRVFTVTDLQNAHTAVAEADGHLLADTTAGAGVIELISTKTFPISGYPYSVILGRGTETEEVVVVTSNDTLLNQLTLLAPTTIDQPGPRSKFVAKALVEAAPNGRTFIRLGVNETRVFGSSGFVRIGFGLVGEETREFDANDIDNNVLSLVRVLLNDHASGETVELVTPGATVETLSVLQQGTGWDIYDTEPRKVKIFIPEDLDEELTLRDASHIHGGVPAAFSTTLAADALSTDTIITVTDISGFPDEAGLVSVDGITRFYVFRDEDLSQLHLTAALGTNKATTAPVDLVRELHPGADIEDGNLRDFLGELVSNQFPGPYLFDTLQKAPSIRSSELAVAITAPTRVIQDAVIGQTCLEVESIITWPVSPFDPFDVALDRDGPNNEVATLVDATFARDASTTLNASPATNPGSTELEGVDTSAFPASNGINPANYRIIVDRGGPNEETILVAQNTIGAPGKFTFVTPTAVAHSPGETIELISDVLTFDPLLKAHDGPSLSPSALGETVEIYVEEVEVADGSQFPTADGTVLLNFGKNRINVRQRITAHPAPDVIELADTSKLPLASPAEPYPITVQEGFPAQEYAMVIDNDTGLNQLTLSQALVNTITPNGKQYARYYGPTPFEFEFVSRDGNIMTLATGTIFPSGFEAGTLAVASSGDSRPNAEGYSYALLMPPGRQACLTFLLDLVRAAGVEIVFL
jgi:hypothetical protein